jgi:hypothetical protein
MFDVTVVVMKNNCAAMMLLIQRELRNQISSTNAGDISSSEDKQYFCNKCTHI